MAKEVFIITSWASAAQASDSSKTTPESDYQLSPCCSFLLMLTFFFPLKSFMVWKVCGSVRQTQSIRSWVLVTRWSWWLASAIDHAGVFPWSALIRKDPPLGWRENKEQSCCCFPILLSKGRKICCTGRAIKVFQFLAPYSHYLLYSY